jgi:hypothetical protein
VRFERTSHIGAIFVVIVLAAASAGAWPHRQGQKARVRFLATSTLIRGTWGQNEDTYLAQLVLPKQNEAVLVRLVDAYPNEWPPLAHKVLTSEAGALLPVCRDQECDRPFGEILLRTAPGDPMAILPERLGYRPPLDRTPAPGTILPCYRVLRQ